MIGLGVITSSNFYVPQINLPGSMATFTLPAAIPVTPAPAQAGVNGGKPGSGLGQIDLFPQGISLPMNFDFVGSFFQTYWPYLLAGGAVLLLLLSRRR
jgi:hypothetical protein